MRHHAHAPSWFLCRCCLAVICKNCVIRGGGVLEDFMVSESIKTKGALEGKGQRMRGKKQTSGTGAWTTNKNTWTRLKSLYSNLGSLQNNKTWSSFNLEGFYRGTKPSKHERLKFAFSSFVLRRKCMDQNSYERAKMLTHFQVFGLIPAAAFDLSVVGSINTFVFLWKERRV